MAGVQRGGVAQHQLRVVHLCHGVVEACFFSVHHIHPYDQSHPLAHLRLPRQPHVLHTQHPPPPLIVAAAGARGRDGIVGRRELEDEEGDIAEPILALGLACWLVRW